MKKILLLLFACLSTCSFSQFSMIGMKTSAELSEIKKMKVVVQLENVDEKGLKDEDRVVAEKMCSDYNTTIQEVVSKFWKFNTNKPEFLTQAQIDDLKNKEDYLVLYVTTLTEGGPYATYTYDKEIDWKKVIKKYESYTSLGNMKTNFKWEEILNLNFDKLKKKKLVTVANGMDIYPLYNEMLLDFVDKGELIQHISTISYFGSKEYEVYLEETPQLETGSPLATMKHQKENEEKMLKDTIRTNETRRKNKEILSKKTLLIRQDFLSKDITEGTIKKWYPFELKVVSKDKLAELLMADLDGKYSYMYYQNSLRIVKMENGLLL